MDKSRILRVRLILTLVMASIGGIFGGVWNRYYNENISFSMIQCQVLILYITQMIVGSMCEKCRKCRKLIFHFHVLFMILSSIIDLATIIAFQFTQSALILFIGDTINFISIIVDDVSYVDMDSALLNGDERSIFTHKRSKYQSIGALISYTLALLLGILIIGDNCVSMNIVIISQYVNWLICLISLPLHILIYKGSKSYVYDMWINKSEDSSN